ncbi:MAG TPA: bifunctional protein-serine/threonine kinase/phosphatase [Gammaproteobacteria bacterium]
MSDKLVVSAGQSSIAGRKSVNEDCCGIQIPDNYLLQTKGIAAIIADGVSSAASGREASEACVRGFLQDYYSTPESWTTKTSVQKVLGALNSWLYGRSIRQHSTGLGFVTTLSALIVKSDTAYIFHVGDTRIYRLRKDSFEQLTRDHRLLAGDNKTFLTHAMGVDPKLQIDYQSIAIEPGDVFLLITDGVHEFVNNDLLLQIISNAGNSSDLEKLAERITQQAMTNNSSDNISCQLIRIESIPFHDNEEAFYRQLTELPFPPPLTAGHILDGFRIIRELHSSKRTQVYLAEDIETKQTVVVKTPSVNYSDDADYIDRFLHEEWVGRRINNQNVLKILPHPRKRQFLYYLTEHYEGQTLRQWMIDHPKPSLTEVRRLLEQIAAGLQAFHRLEMLHQDIKPENILIDDSGTVKIIDLGSTKIAGIDEIKKPLTQRDLALGTINYSAPEILGGNKGGMQSDLYSVGVIAYEMLTGHLPYGEEPTARKLQRTDYTPARAYNPDLPIWIDGALRKAVHKQPGLRYELLSEFIYDLSNPNATFIRDKPEPLIERNPIRFWQILFLASIVLNIVLLYLLSR